MLTVCHWLGWHLKELRLNKLWDTEHTASYTMNIFPSYAKKKANASMVAKQPDDISVSPCNDSFDLEKKGGRLSFLEVS